jgi:hypothetical protein
MIWLTWRQSRAQVFASLAVIAVMALAMAITGPHLLSTFHANRNGFLDELRGDRIAETLYIVGVLLMYMAPAIIGAFWGGPLIARELEHGTHRLVWNQSITRTRWLAGKVGVTGLIAVALVGVLCLAVTWWASPIDESVDNGQQAGPFSLTRLFPPAFGARGIVPIGYLVFGFAAGVAIGLLVRRSLPAVAITLGVIIAVQIVVPVVVRAHLATPERQVAQITSANLRGFELHGDPSNPGPVYGLRIRILQPGDWELSNHPIDASGATPKSLPAWLGKCFDLSVPAVGRSDPEADERASQQPCFDRLTALGYRQSVTYQPASRFWTLQWRETTMLLALAALLFGFSFWWIRRDLT